MDREEIKKNANAIRAIKHYIHCRLDESPTVWKALVNKHFNGDKDRASKMLVAIMSFPNLFEE